MYNNLKLYPRYFFVISSLLFIFIFELLLLQLNGDLAILKSNDNAFVRVFLDKIYSSPSTIFPLIYFIAVQLILHVLFICGIYGFYEYLLNFFKNNFINNLETSSKLKLYLLFVLYLSFSYFLILILNNHYYPNSAFAFKNIFQNNLIIAILDNLVLFLFAVISTVITLLIGIIYLIKKHIKNNFFILISLLFLIIYLTFDLINIKHNTNSNTINKNPNIILLTIDSLRFDFAKELKGVDDTNFNISSFIDNSISFSNAYTPLARTFPALYSILSGNYPIDENIRFNLVEQKNIKFEQLLPNILKQNNYETLYATDSSQFHIINKDWGYNNIVAPAQGIYEQFIPKINDFPLSNIIINSPVSKYLFPYTYGNQAAHRLYDPITYVNTLKKSINKLNKNKSLFLHLNFEAAHWPYQNRYLSPELPFQERYKYCLNTVNWQVNQVLNFLKEHNLLNNTIVILTSDHGEALSIKNDKLINKNNFIGDPKLLSYVNKHPINYTFDEIKNNNILDVILDINSTAGHGVDVLSKSQYQTVVAIQKFINNSQQYVPKIVKNNIISNDLYNTIIDLSEISTKNNKKNSISLAPFIESEFNKDQSYHEKLANRSLFIETDLQVPYLDINELKDQNIIDNFIKTWSQYYYINDRNYLELTADAVSKLLATKQYAVIHNNDILAYIPSGIKQQWRIIENKIENKLDANNTCNIPRPILDINGNKLATLCGYYKNSPSYYIHYNVTLDKWNLYPTAADFRNNIQVQALNNKLVTQFKSEIKT